MDITDDVLRDIFGRVRRIACVGASANAARPSRYVSEFLRGKGYQVVGVNPGLAGQTLFGETVVARLADIDPAPDMVDIFRRAEEVPAVVDEAIAAFPPGVIWMQLGIRHAEAAARAEAAGWIVVQDRCPKIEHPRIFGR